jgi:formylglycine-generating enzyme required for sulfatase activity
VLDDVLLGTPAGTGPKAITNSVGTSFVLVPAGKFQMGSPADEAGHRANEGPVHEVVIGSAFYLSVHVVTQGAYLAVTGANPARFGATDGGGPDYPVESVSWLDAVAFCQQLSARADERAAGRSYRLPTEAEWEYAARAGTATPFAAGATFGPTDGNCAAPYPEGAPGGAVGCTTPVSRYPASAWGCTTWPATCGSGAAIGTARRTTPRRRCATHPAAGKFRVLRGGSWKNQGAACRAAYRNALAPHQRDSATGFRVVMVVTSERP